MAPGAQAGPSDATPPLRGGAWSSGCWLFRSSPPQVPEPSLAYPVPQTFAENQAVQGPGGQGEGKELCAQPYKREPCGRAHQGKNAARMLGVNTGGSGSAPEQLRGDQPGPQEKAALLPKPLHDSRASRQEHEGSFAPSHASAGFTGNKNAPGQSSRVLPLFYFL